MFYFKQLNDDNTLHSLLKYNSHCSVETNDSLIEITEEEYNTLLAEIEEKIRLEAEQEAESDNISDSEALSIILGEEAESE